MKKGSHGKKNRKKAPAGGTRMVRLSSKQYGNWKEKKGRGRKTNARKGNETMMMRAQGSKLKRIKGS